MRLHESMLFDPITERTNFCARKLTSFEAFEQLNIPNERVVSVALARASPAAAHVERLIPASRAKRPVLAHHRLCQPAALLSQSDHLLSSILATRAGWMYTSKSREPGRWRQIRRVSFRPRSDRPPRARLSPPSRPPAAVNSDSLGHGASIRRPRRPRGRRVRSFFARVVAIQASTRWRSSSSWARARSSSPRDAGTSS